MTAPRRFGRLELPSGARLYVERTRDGTAHVPRAPWLDAEDVGCALLADQLVAECRTLAPVEPSKIVCVGRNYADHAKELGNEVPEEPLLFLKPPSALLDPGGDIVLPLERLSKRVEHEVELGVVIGRRLTRASQAECAAGIFGYTIVGDITARDLQKSDKQWTRGKGLDTFCPVGPEIVRGLDAADLGVRCRVNGELRQNGRTAQMIFSPAALCAFISDAMTLEPGDLVVTGTPAGVGPLVAGDRVSLEIDGIGALEVGVRACPS